MKRLFSPNQAILFFSVLLIAGMSSIGCKKILKVDMPVGKNTEETVFKDKNTAVAAINGVYGSTYNTFSGVSGLSFSAALRADELRPDFPADFPDYRNIASGDGIGWGMWRIYEAANQIYQLNSIIQGVGSSPTLTEQTKTTLLGEAKFMRAWAYFYLVNFYGDVPLVLTTDFRENSNIARSPVTKIYERIIADLKEAQSSLNPNYLERDLISTTADRIRPNRTAATALLARAYLYTEKWEEAEAEATKIIDDSTFELLPNLNNVFLKNSKETIWALQPNILDAGGVNPKDGRDYINTYGGAPAFNVSDFLLNSFEDGDKRKIHWITFRNGHNIPYKYKEGIRTTVQKEYYIVLRIAEQYLIRAEARMHLNKLTGSQSASSDLNAVRLRAGLNPTNAVTKAELLSAIMKERRVELFTEWGHRWFDLIRTKTVNTVMSVVAPAKGGVWQAYKSLLPIPYSEFELNPSLKGNQNPGYQEHP